MNRVIVLGKNGQLGRCLARVAPGFTYLSSAEVDLSKVDEIPAQFQALGFGLQDLKELTVINAAAYTRVDQAEIDMVLAEKINGLAPGVLAGLFLNFIHVSTDYVFDGISDRAYQEDDIGHTPNPKTVYGKSKLQGETLAQARNPNTWVFRTSWLFSEYGQNFVKTMLRVGRERGEVHVVDDQMGIPTSARDLAQFLVALARDLGALEPGVYHFANSGPCTWYQFAKVIFQAAGLERVKVWPISTEAYVKRVNAPYAPRPKMSVLDTTKLQRCTPWRPRPWTGALTDVLAAHWRDETSN
jgi:dTDP-4-dehydrorhamnose reductase